MQGSLAPTLLALSLPSPPTVIHTPSVSVGLYPQPPAACLEQQQRETAGSQSRQGGRETLVEREREEGRHEVEEDTGYFHVFNGQIKPDANQNYKTKYTWIARQTQ